MRRFVAQEWGKPYLTRDGLDSLWAAIPDHDKEYYVSTKDLSLEKFAQQQELSDQVCLLGILHHFLVLR